MASNTVRLAFTGEQLISAVREIADTAVVRPDFLDGKNVFVLGQTSEYPYEHLAILVNGNRLVDPTARYESFTVLETEWGGMVYAVGFGPEQIVKAVKEFSEKLQAKLMEMGATSVVPNEISFEFEGIEYRCPMEAYHKDRIILPDGRILSVDGWLESMPPQPAGLRVIGRVDGVIAIKA